jgi:drug/metabolite transporter (DMT)-like permease
VNPVVALFVGWTVGGEGLDARTLLASLVIVAGVALVVTSPAPQRSAASTWPSARSKAGPNRAGSSSIG